MVSRSPVPVITASPAAPGTLADVDVDVDVTTDPTPYGNAVASCTIAVARDPRYKVKRYLETRSAAGSHPPFSERALRKGCAVENCRETGLRRGDTPLLPGVTATCCCCCCRRRCVSSASAFFLRAVTTTNDAVAELSGEHTAPIPEKR
ncbi:PREDICTED: uncharacterized protein LOC105567262 [Vollenhovia emeryi]|uniref:uncharacterized protein LOC105567262 n=1 Tax=Vollenhovia emeryi TaxID=411798 RepID=UPI0005F43533|nr:PREDICTED: uncharacterized protein LOC105567262 [Vollenhovia emeryi]